MTEQTSPVAHSDNWKFLFERESEDIKKVFGNFLLDIQHIGSTSIPDILAKPIIDIAVQIKSFADAEKFIKPLEKLGYFYKAELSSSERHFFQKGNPFQFHLSICYIDRGGYWNRQILFRDYLIGHPESRREYEQIKLSQTDKSEFVQKILALAESK